MTVKCRSSVDIDVPPVDSEQTVVGSQEMFGSYIIPETQKNLPAGNLENERQTSECNNKCVCKENSKTLSSILKELKDLKDKVIAGNQISTTFVVDGSPLEAPLVSYLKSKFPEKIFLGNPDIDLKNKVMSLASKLSLKQELSTMLRGVKRFAARKYVEYRSQTKAKLMSSNEDLGLCALPDLSKKLFRRFKSENLETEAVMRNTVLLRCHCHDLKLFKKQNSSSTEQGQFWNKFLELSQRVNSEDEDTLERVRQREERRIERYLNK